MNVYSVPLFLPTMDNFGVPSALHFGLFEYFHQHSIELLPHVNLLSFFSFFSPDKQHTFLALDPK